MTFTGRAYAKINWALDITGRLPNGYHALDMVMQSVDLCDDMAFEDAPDIRLWVNGAAAPDPEKNLVVRAARALNAHAGTGRGVAMRLEKRIPARAGLGGGSADCALALRALNRLWGLGLSDEALLDIGARLGADVPFCLTGGLARVTGFGEKVAPLERAAAIPLGMVTPGGGLSTAEVFALWDSGGFAPVALDAPALADAVSRGDVGGAGRLCANALTAPAIALMPEIGRLIERFRALGAKAAFMTGSGSTVVGAFDSDAAARAAAERVPGAIFTRTRTTIREVF